MNKLLTTVAASLVATLSFTAVNSGEFRAGVAMVGAGDYATATETRKDSLNKSKQEAVLAHSYGVLFGEFAMDAAGGLTLGFEYAPETIQLETETRNIRPSATGDSGSQVIAAEVEDIMTAYVSLPIGGTGAYAKVGYSMATLNTKETLATGSTYGNVDMTGTQLGLGYHGEIGDKAFYKLEGNYSAWDDIAVNGSEVGGTSGSFNKIEAKITGVSARLAVGLRF